MINPNNFVIQIEVLKKPSRKCIDYGGVKLCFATCNSHGY